MAALLPTIPVHSFTYIGSFVVETEDEDDVVTSIPPSPINVGTEDHDGNDDDDSSCTNSIDINNSNDHVDESVISSGDDYDNVGRCCIDHTALLLGDEYEEEEDDDEREWNVSFSLDELERNNDHLVDGMDEQQQQPPYEMDGEKNIGDKDDANNDDGIQKYHTVAEHEEEAQEEEDGQSCTSEFVHFHNGFVESYNQPVSKPTMTNIITTNAIQRAQPHQRDQQQQVLRHASSLPTPIHSVPSLPSTNPRLKRHDTFTSSSSYNIISSQPSMIQNDVWRREEEEQQAYATMPRKKINTFENKKKVAAMKALAMKERASSALVSRATRAKEKFKEKITISAKNAPVQGDNRDLKQSEKSKKMTKMHSMKTYTRDYDNCTNITSLVSPEVSPSFSLSSNLPITTTKKTHMMRRAMSSLSSDTGSPKEDKTSATTHNYRSLSHRAQRAKVKALGTMNGVLAAAVSSTSSATSSTSTSTTSFNRRQQTNDTNKANKQQIINTVFSLEDDDTMSDIPSVLNSEGPSSVQDISYHGSSSIAVVSGPSDGRNIVINNSKNKNTVYSTPKMKRGSRKKCGGGGDDDEVGVGGSNRNTMEESMTDAVMISPSHIYSPEQILANLSNISSLHTIPTREAAADASFNSIDGDGFLISPSSASIHRRWDNENDQGADALSSSSSQAAILPTVGSAISSEGGGGSTFDPNSFLFLSPLSDHDLDDPDYGMPFLLSRSNSHNAVVMDSSSTTPTRPTAAREVPPPPPGLSTMTTLDKNLKPSSSAVKATSSPSPTISHSKRLMMRFPPSPRIVPSPKLLPPSGKKMIKKMKQCGGGGGGGGDSGGVILKHGNTCVNKSRPPLIQNRAQSSTF